MVAGILADYIAVSSVGVAWKLIRMLSAFWADSVADVEGYSAAFALMPIAEFCVSLL